MKTRFILLVAALAFCAPGARVIAQVTPKTLDAVQQIGPDGSVDFSIQMSFDAAPWKAWKSQVGDEPARLRAMMQYQFSAYSLSDFKLEKDDLNRTAKITMKSVAGPELRKDGSFRIPIEREFRLVNHSGREWFFSGNNPYAANSLNTVKLVLPPNLIDASLVSAGSADQAVIYTVNVPSGHSRGFMISGIVLLVIGVGLLVAAVLIKAGPAAPAAHATA